MRAIGTNPNVPLAPAGLADVARIQASLGGLPHAPRCARALAVRRLVHRRCDVRAGRAALPSLRRATVRPLCRRLLRAAAQDPHLQQWLARRANAEVGVELIGAGAPIPTVRSSQRPSCRRFARTKRTLQGRDPLARIGRSTRSDSKACACAGHPPSIPTLIEFGRGARGRKGVPGLGRQEPDLLIAFVSAEHARALRCSLGAAAAGIRERLPVRLLRRRRDRRRT